ncbi:hypothetical protein ACFV2S_14820 [Streptomyces sp. NPDC059695]|uniref:hypothetical protein n=1 Tax=Streptomyces sp. NPDC059695 TaxID=3346910 RepID=UPI0036CABF8C
MWSTRKSAAASTAGVGPGLVRGDVADIACVDLAPCPNPLTSRLPPYLPWHIGRIPDRCAGSVCLSYRIACTPDDVREPAAHAPEHLLDRGDHLRVHGRPSHRTAAQDVGLTQQVRLDAGVRRAPAAQDRFGRGPRLLRRAYQ